MRLFLDASVLIRASRATPESDRYIDSIAFLFRQRRTFVTSPFVSLEVLPKPRFFDLTHIVAWLEAFFQVAVPVSPSHKLVKLAHTEAETLGLGGMDALHLAAAHIGKADLFVTLEEPNKPMYATELVRVIHLRDVRRILG